MGTGVPKISPNSNLSKTFGQNARMICQLTPTLGAGSPFRNPQSPINSHPKSHVWLEFCRKISAGSGADLGCRPKGAKEISGRRYHHVTSHQDVPKMQSQDYAQSEGGKARDVPEV